MLPPRGVGGAAPGVHVPAFAAGLGMGATIGSVESDLPMQRLKELFHVRNGLMVLLH